MAFFCAFLGTLACVRLAASLFPYWTKATGGWKATLSPHALGVDAVFAAVLSVFIWFRWSRRNVLACLVAWACFLNLRYFPVWLDGIPISVGNRSHSLQTALEQAREQGEPYITALYDFYSYLGANYPFSQLTIAEAHGTAAVLWMAEGVGKTTIVVDPSYDPRLSDALADALLAMSHKAFPGNAFVRPFHVFEQNLSLMNPEFHVYQHPTRGIFVMSAELRKGLKP